MCPSKCLGLIFFSCSQGRTVEYFWYIKQVASGDVDMAIGGDQGGSIRIPSSWCGIVGMKPTHGLVPYTGALALEENLDHLGPMTQTVYDAALLLEVSSDQTNQIRVCNLHTMY